MDSSTRVSLTCKQIRARAYAHIESHHACPFSAPESCHHDRRLDNGISCSRGPALGMMECISSFKESDIRTHQARPDLSPSTNLASDQTVGMRKIG